MGGTGLCVTHMPRCQAVCADEPGAAPASCLYAGWPDELSGFKLCRSHNKLGLVKSAQALQFLEPVRLDSLSVQQLVASLFSGCPGDELSLHNDLGAKLCSLLSATDLANVEAACKAELARKHSEQQSSELTRCIELQNGGLEHWALELLKTSAEVRSRRRSTQFGRRSSCRS